MCRKSRHGVKRPPKAFWNRHGAIKHGDIKHERFGPGVGHTPPMAAKGIRDSGLAKEPGTRSGGLRPSSGRGPSEPGMGELDMGQSIMKELGMGSWGHTSDGRGLSGPGSHPAGCHSPEGPSMHCRTFYKRRRLQGTDHLSANTVARGLHLQKLSRIIFCLAACDSVSLCHRLPRYEGRTHYTEC